MSGGVDSAISAYILKKQVSKLTVVVFLISEFRDMQLRQFS